MKIPMIAPRTGPTRVRPTAANPEPSRAPLGAALATLGLLLGALLSGALRADGGPALTVTPPDCGRGGVSLVVTAADRFDPLVQQLLLKQQLSGHPVIDQPRFLVIPYRDDGSLTEAQIHYLERLLRRANQP